MAAKERAIHHKMKTNSQQPSLSEIITATDITHTEHNSMSQQDTAYSYHQLFRTHQSCTFQYFANTAAKIKPEEKVPKWLLSVSITL